jgi:hypothetical protein
VRLEEPTRLPDGGVQFQLVSTPGRSYVVERSEDLKEWSEVTLFESASGQEAVEDTVTSDSGSAFYRARKHP